MKGEKKGNETEQVNRYNRQVPNWLKRAVFSAERSGQGCH